MTAIDLSKLSDPFPASDIEWRVSRAGTGKRGIYCNVLCYITARAVQQRLDDVCGTANWLPEKPQILEINDKSAFAVGITIRCGPIGDEWLTKWDVAEPTNIEAAKGGFSGAMKRAGAQWGIGRYLYYLDEAFAEVSEEDPKVRGWHWAKLPKEGGTYYWKTPQLPGWALPKEPEHEVSKVDLNELKKLWQSKFATDSTDPATMRDGFAQLVRSTVGEFPYDDHACWTTAALTKCSDRIAATVDPGDISPDVPFESE